MGTSADRACNRLAVDIPHHLERTVVPGEHGPNLPQPRTGAERHLPGVAIEVHETAIVIKGEQSSLRLRDCRKRVSRPYRSNADSVGGCARDVVHDLPLTTRMHNLSRRKLNVLRPVRANLARRAQSDLCHAPAFPSRSEA